MRTFLSFCLTVLVLGAQDKPFSVDVKVVNVFATVRDSKGTVVRNLRQEDFKLDEDGRPQTIKYFSQESNLPLTLGLLVDTSMSQRRVLADERRASYRFLDQVMREDKDLAFVIHFDFDVELLQDLTSSRQKLQAALELLEMPQQRPQLNRGGSGGGTGYPGGGPGGPGGPQQRRRGGRGGGGGGTALYDSVLLASDELMRKQTGRKALIVLSDGVDTGSIESLENAIESAQRADTLVYTILFSDEQAYGNSGVFNPRGGMGRRGGGGGGGMGRPGPGQQPSHENGKKIMEHLAKFTGGGFFEVSKKHPIEEVYQRIEEELRNQYSLGYSPDREESGYHRLHVTTKQRGLIVQARDGYYTSR